MSNDVQLSVTAGPMKGKAFSFDEHDTFLFGRSKECLCCLPDDSLVSRRHFIIEVSGVNEEAMRMYPPHQL